MISSKYFVQPDSPSATPLRSEFEEWEISQAIAHARQLLSTNDILVLEDERLRLIATAALEVRTLFFAAAMQEPATEDLELCFEDFVIRAVSGGQCK